MQANLALIVGPMRSGTSLVAAMVHRLGWHAAPTIMAPVPPHWRSDWEDPVLTRPLMIQAERSLRLMSPIREPNEKHLRTYIESRMELSRRLGFEGRIAIKSPYLALIWPRVVRVLDTLPDVRPVAIGCKRDPEAIKASLARTDLSEDHQKGILAALADIEPDMSLSLEEALEAPLIAARRLAMALHGTDDAQVLDALAPDIEAAARIAGYTESSLCPPSSVLQCSPEQALSLPEASWMPTRRLPAEPEGGEESTPSRRPEPPMPSSPDSNDPNSSRDSKPSLEDSREPAAP